MSEPIPPSQQALEEALELSGDILKNIELSEAPLSNIVLKAIRLARLLNDFEYQKILNYEARGYPSNPDGIQHDAWKLTVMAQRRSEEKNTATQKVYSSAYVESIGYLEDQLSTIQISIDTARDANISVSSANPNQYIILPPGNAMERRALREKHSIVSKRLSERRAFIHDYVLRKHYELKFSGVASDVFSQFRRAADGAIGSLVPDAVKKFTAVYDNLRSENPEDWSNAVHSCRRILQDLADAVFPPSTEERIAKIEGQKKKIKLGPSNYINRIMCFIEDNSKSERFTNLVGSHLRFIGDRLDAVFEAAQKGSHATILSREEADRYVIYTYLIVGDILSLKEKEEKSKIEKIPPHKIMRTETEIKLVKPQKKKDD